MIDLVLRSDVALLDSTEDSLVFDKSGWRMRLRGLGERAEERLSGLRTGPMELGAEPGEAFSRRMLTVVQMLTARDLVELRCGEAGNILLTAVSVSELSQVTRMTEPGGGKLFRLSKFVCTRRSGSALIIESPRKYFRVEVVDPGVLVLVGLLARPQSAESLVQNCAVLEREAVHDTLAFLGLVGAVVECREDGKSEEDLLPVLVQREFHDVLMHSKSRQGLAGEVVAGTFRFAGEFVPLPALKEPMGASAVPLPRPTGAAGDGSSMSLAEAMEKRRSVRSFSTRPLPAAQLGEFLFRTARLRGTHPMNKDDPLSYEFSDRPYPSGGGIYDVEIYPVVRNCEGIPSGLYHYDPEGHALELVSRAEEVVRGFVHTARISAVAESEPQVVLVLSSRFSRLSWKYQGLAYATTLKNVGVLYEAMYLVATDMGLAPCALGGGDAVLFSRATGLDVTEESTVGEFMLGIEG
ncbi:SagB/ThcOx family dehydrogenase [Actinomadura roseirufa]|uniref:SagB/ThcOx family dehydrogenase n=1 Tax=Actinomadura roseirufa TaxID=2094049 RepID=UPI001041522F|nr:SagB family peptide dehydrogenase [Actinomadura roseirufa]